MSQRFQIYKVEGDGSLRLIEEASELERARARVKKLAAFSPGEYIITDQPTGERISIKTSMCLLSGTPHRKKLEKKWLIG